MRAVFDRMSVMRAFLSTIATLLLLAALPAQAQDAKQAFTGSGATEARACAAAKADAQAWVKRGRSEGRRREVLGSGKCACTPTDGAFTCRIEAQVREAAYEEEEER